jgi:hypothetical protein
MFAKFATGLPSPLSSSDDLSDHRTSDSHELTSTPENAPAAPSSSAASRKRRLSDADGQPAFKRPRGLLRGPRLQAVSDPLPMSSAIEEASKLDSWFLPFDIPSPVTAEELDPSVPVDIEFFNDWPYVNEGQQPDVQKRA